jgi:3-hydroxybutyryl-CoA dehydrogenase
MGAGIAQLGCTAGIETLLHDPVADALTRGLERARAGLAKLVERERLSQADADAAAGRLRPALDIDALSGCEVVIEAAPERLDLKRELFERLSVVCGREAVLATNTSSIPVTTLAGAVEAPERVVGMHFFNPAPVMKLVEVIAAEQTGEPALALARATGEAMGKRVIVASDGPGFLVNRCGRPFYTEALRLLG